MPTCVLCKTHYEKHSHECTPGCAAFEKYKKYQEYPELGEARAERRPSLNQRLSDGFFMLSDEMLAGEDDE